MIPGICEYATISHVTTTCGIDQLYSTSKSDSIIFVRQQNKETKSSQIWNELKTHLAYLSATTALHRPQYFMSSVLSMSIIDYCAVWRINNYYNQTMHRNRLPAETFKRRWVKLLTQRWFSAEFTAPFLRIFSAFAWEKVYCTNDANCRSCLMRCYNFQRRPTLTN